MAGDWMKVEKDTPEKPEVLAIAAALGVSPDEAFGKCFKLWRWADSQTTDGCNAHVTLALLDCVAGVTGFARAMVSVGWLEERPGGAIVFPRFDRHMGQSAKARALTSQRVASHRRQKCNAPPVTKPLPEKRREEYKKKPPFIPPSEDEVRAYCRERDNRVDAASFVSHYQSNGWRVGRNPMKDWRAAVRTWEKNDRQGAFAAAGANGAAPVDFKARFREILGDIE